MYEKSRLCAQELKFYCLATPMHFSTYGQTAEDVQVCFYEWLIADSVKCM